MFLVTAHHDQASLCSNTVKMTSDLIDAVTTARSLQLSGEYSFTGNDRGISIDQIHLERLYRKAEYEFTGQTAPEGSPRIYHSRVVSEVWTEEWPQPAFKKQFDLLTVAA